MESTLEERQSAREAKQRAREIVNAREYPLGTELSFTVVDLRGEHPDAGHVIGHSGAFLNVQTVSRGLLSLSPRDVTVVVAS